MPPEMMVGEAVGQGSIGLVIALALDWLKQWAAESPRVRGDITKLVVFLSHFGSLVAAFGIHWVFEGDLLTAGAGGTVQIQIPDIYHIANAIVLYGSNLGTQKLFADNRKAARALSALAKAKGVL